MLMRLLFGVGMFALGYVIGKEVGRAEGAVRYQLEWYPVDGDRGYPGQTGPDAVFENPPMGVAPEAQGRRRPLPPSPFWG